MHAVPADFAGCRLCPFRGAGCEACPISQVGRLRWLTFGPPLVMILVIGAYVVALIRG
jgi:hypothetical protein